MCYINYIPEQNGTHLPTNYKTNNFFHLLVWGFGVDHLPDSILNLCEDTLNLVILYLNFEILNIYK